jgi:hypothetical protein
MAVVTVEALERELATTLERFTEAAARLDFKEAEYWAVGAAHWLERIRRLLMTEEEREMRRSQQNPRPF